MNFIYFLCILSYSGSIKDLLLTSMLHQKQVFGGNTF